ncbi:hypothetical protein R2601_12920 [Salipiger bermudensis HTCC2601]|uniref:Uncharacterized protein n=1 Tax=Salipiger bermudensis (strain DSM 26914 / JCM 13377 / KCTC 12554 / HTCC2601) TaxID=314265 RepID=Q0FLS4_SALBH|nr:hypothetical protein R2601_12920 [Salipiger bermudensis HTCC2601]
MVFHFASLVTLSVPAVSPRNSRRPLTKTSRKSMKVAGSTSHGDIEE